MMRHLIAILVLNEVRLRLRRLSTIVVLLLVAAISWGMVADPASGSVLMAVGEARVLYTSSALALGSASLGGLLFALAGFFLVRGRVGEDIRSGVGSVIAATPAGNTVFLLGRWLGSVAYLMALVGVFMLTVLACHLVRGEGPLQLTVFVYTYMLLLVPMVLFVASCALLFDSWAPLMGKAGDLLFFCIWVGQIALMATIGEHGRTGLSNTMLFDFNGLTVAIASLGMYLDTTHLSIGATSYDAALAPIMLPSNLWNVAAVLLRASSAALALLPLLPALWLFHRYSPDKVKPSRASRRRSPLAVLNSLLRPLTRLVQPGFGLAARLPAAVGQVLADVTLTLVAAPAAIAALIAALAAGLLLDGALLGPLMIVCVAFWGVLVADVSTRDFQADTEALTGTVGGGPVRRYLRQLAASLVLGLMFMGVIVLRWAAGAPMRAIAAVAGIAALGACASLLGRSTRSARTFMALFLFGLYVATNVSKAPMLDVVGFNGVANAASTAGYLVIAVVAGLAGYAWNLRQAR